MYNLGIYKNVMSGIKGGLSTDPNCLIWGWTDIGAKHPRKRRSFQKNMDEYFQCVYCNGIVMVCCGLFVCVLVCLGVFFLRAFLLSARKWSRWRETDGDWT